MIISRTPFRVSLFGGGTDYPAWYEQHGGAVLGGSIDKYCYLTCRYLPPYFEHRMRIVYSIIETCNSIDEIQHPVVREALRYLRVDRGLEIHYDGDLPGRSGMGSSSAFTVGLLNAIYALRGKMISRPNLAKEAIHVERDLMGETVGNQDQIMASYGGFNLVEFTTSGEFTVQPVTVPRSRLAELSSHLMLFYSGRKRVASDVAKAYAQDMDAKRRQLRNLRSMVDEALGVITGSGSLDPIGDLLHEAWQNKRSLGAGISTPEVDEMYATALKAGASGGKLLGAGGGGFLLFFVPPEKQAEVTRALHPLIHVPFQFSAGGSEVIFYNPAEDEGLARQARLSRPTGSRESYPPPS